MLRVDRAAPQSAHPLPPVGGSPILGGWITSGTLQLFFDRWSMTTITINAIIAFTTTTSTVATVTTTTLR